MKVAVIMGSKSDWETMKHTCDVLEALEIPYEKKVVSAHRTPDLMFEYTETARHRGIQVIIAGAEEPHIFLVWLLRKQPFPSSVFPFNQRP